MSHEGVLLVFNVVVVVVVVVIIIEITGAGIF